MINDKSNTFFSEGNEHKDRPLYAIGVVADMIGTTNQTLRLYEKRGLIKPFRKNKNRLYSENDVRWLFCIRDLIHNKKISIEGIKKLLKYAPCWEITVCQEIQMAQCRASRDRETPCWVLNNMICQRNADDNCDKCVVLLSKTRLGKETSLLPEVPIG